MYWQHCKRNYLLKLLLTYYENVFLSKRLRIWRYNTLFYLLIELFMLNFEIPFLSYVGHIIYDGFENRLPLNPELRCTFFLEKRHV